MTNSPEGAAGSGVQCATCGFLTLRNHLTGQLDEAEDTFRSTGEPPQRIKPGIHGVMLKSRMEAYEYPYSSDPLCFMRAANLGQELSLVSAEARASAALVVITKDRHCSSFGEWELGFTPQEHREKLDRESALTAAQEREDTRDNKVAERHRTDLVAGALIAISSVIVGGIIAKLSF